MTADFLLYAVLVLLLVTAVLTVITDRLVTAVVYSAVFSAVIAFVYLLLAAPDVALAEAVIGSVLTTVMFLVTLKKYKLFTVRYLPGQDAEDAALSKVLSCLSACLKEHDLEPNLIESKGEPAALSCLEDTDLVAARQESGIILYGEANSQYLTRICEELDRNGILNHVTVTDTTGLSKNDYREDCI